MPSNKHLVELRRYLLEVSVGTRELKLPVLARYVNNAYHYQAPSLDICEAIGNYAIPVQQRPARQSEDTDICEALARVALNQSRKKIRTSSKVMDISGGRKPSGSLAYLQFYDRVAEIVKSGGTRRAQEALIRATGQPPIDLSGAEAGYISRQLPSSGNRPFTLHHIPSGTKLSGKISHQADHLK